MRSLDILGEVGPAAVRARSRGRLGGLFAPPGVQDVRFVQAKLGHGDLWVIRFHVLHDVRLGLVLIR